MAIPSVAIVDVSAATGAAAVKADQTVIVRAGGSPRSATAEQL